MEMWRKVWREGVVPQLTLGELKALEQGLLKNDPALIQGYTCTPPSLMQFKGEKVQGACALSYGPWKEGGLLVGDLEKKFAEICYECDKAMGEPAICRFFLNAFDTWSRLEMLENLLPEVQLVIKDREEVELGKGFPVTPLGIEDAV